MTKNLCVFTLCSHFIQKTFTQSTLFLHVFPIDFNHRQLEIAATQKRLQDFFHNTRADKKLSALLPFSKNIIQQKQLPDKPIFRFTRQLLLQSVSFQRTRIPLLKYNIYHVTDIHRQYGHAFSPADFFLASCHKPYYGAEYNQDH